MYSIGSISGTRSGCTPTMACDASPCKVTLNETAAAAGAFFSTLADIFVTSATAAEAYDSLFVEQPQDLDNFALCTGHILELDLAHEIHLFLHHFDRSARHVCEEAILQLGHRTLESKGKDL